MKKFIKHFFYISWKNYLEIRENDYQQLISLTRLVFLHNSNSKPIFIRNLSYVYKNKAIKDKVKNIPLNSSGKRCWSR